MNVLPDGVSRHLADKCLQSKMACSMTGAHATSNREMSQIGSDDMGLLVQLSSALATWVLKAM